MTGQEQRDREEHRRNVKARVVAGFNDTYLRLGMCPQACGWCLADRPVAAPYTFANGSVIECDVCWLRSACWLPFWRVAS